MSAQQLREIKGKLVIARSKAKRMDTKMRADATPGNSARAAAAWDEVTKLTDQLEALLKARRYA
jgi:hypothetical protein